MRKGCINTWNVWNERRSKVKKKQKLKEEQIKNHIFRYMEGN